jgi:phosphoserine phosphatase RsbU/P
VTPLDVGGTIVGMFPDCQFEEGSLTIQPGSLLVAYSDGITEPENAYGEQFGRQRLTEVIQRNRGQRPENIRAAVVAAVDQWAGTPEQSDDMTVVIASAQ